MYLLTLLSADTCLQMIRTCGIHRKKRRLTWTPEAGVIIDRPLKMMLAQIAPGIKEAVEEMGTAAVEWKFDGLESRYIRMGTR